MSLFDWFVRGYIIFVLPCDISSGNKIQQMLIAGYPSLSDVYFYWVIIQVLMHQVQFILTGTIPCRVLLYTTSKVVLSEVCTHVPLCHFWFQISKYNVSGVNSHTL